MCHKDYSMLCTYPNSHNSAALVASATGYVHSTPSSNPTGNNASAKNPNPDIEKPSKTD